MAVAPDRLRISSARPRPDELLLAVNGALREIAAAIKDIDTRVEAVSTPTPSTTPEPRTGVTASEVQYAVDLAVYEATRSVPGAAALRAIKAHPDGSVRYLSYLNSAGDGVGGVFVYDAESTDPEDQVDHIRPDNVGAGFPGRWVRSVNP